MNRKKGIIIATTGIFIVTMALIGFTYGFYMSLVSGNESSKRVKVSAGKSRLEYVELSNEVDTIIGPGYTNTKYFAVKNVGDISASYYIFLTDVENTYKRKNDIVYTIYRKLYDYSEVNSEPESFDTNVSYDFSEWENVTNTNCPIVSEYPTYGDCQYPSTKSQLTTQKQTIMEKEDYYVYAFQVTYINQPDIDQILDEESVFSGIVKIYGDEVGTDVSPFEEGTLADAIVKNALANKNGTIYSETPLTKPLYEISGENEATLSLTTDSNGPTYYFRGAVEDNYVLFNNICWRIVRIQGDGSIKLTLAGEVAIGATDCTGVTDISALINGGAGVIYGYKTITGLDETTWYMADYKNDTAGASKTSLKESLDTWFDSKFKSEGNLTNAGLKLKEETWCLGGSYDYKYNDSTGTLLDDAGLQAIYDKYLEDDMAHYHWYYSSAKRLFVTKTTDLTCGIEEEKITSRVGALTSDEIALAGAKGNSVANKSYYLYDNAQGMYYWTLSLFDFDGSTDDVFSVFTDGSLSGDNVGHIDLASRPAVTLLSTTMVTQGGEGTQSNPYVVE